MRRRSKKRGKAKTSHASRGGAKPVVFRLAGLASRTALTTRRAKSDPPEDAAHPMAALLPSVVPLEGAERVAPPVKRARPPRASTERNDAEVLPFVVKHDGARVEAYRADSSAPPKLAARGSWTPETQVDLHGARARDVHARLALTLRECSRHRKSRLLVIHGKGLHSARGESVLAAAVIESLTAASLARYVRAFATAPEHLGGSGALAVDVDVSPS